jgi:hypothetical protein
VREVAGSNPVVPTIFSAAEYYAFFRSGKTGYFFRERNSAIFLLETQTPRRILCR